MLEHTTDGGLAAHLLSQNQTAVNAHFSFTVLDQNEEDDESWGHIPFAKKGKRIV